MCHISLPLLPPSSSGRGQQLRPNPDPHFSRQQTLLDRNGSNRGFPSEPLRLPLRVAPTGAGFFLVCPLPIKLLSSLFHFLLSFTVSPSFWFSSMADLGVYLSALSPFRKICISGYLVQSHLHSFPIAAPLLAHSTVGTFSLSPSPFLNSSFPLISVFGQKVFSLGQGHHCVYFFFNLFFSQGWKIPKACASDGWVSFLKVQWPRC